MALDDDFLKKFIGAKVKLTLKVDADRTYFYRGILVDVGGELLVINDHMVGKCVLRNSAVLACEEVRD